MSFKDMKDQKAAAEAATKAAAEQERQDKRNLALDRAAKMEEAIKAKNPEEVGLSLSREGQTIQLTRGQDTIRVDVGSDVYSCLILKPGTGGTKGSFTIPTIVPGSQKKFKSADQVLKYISDNS
ncbi:hypothetical protein [Bradyrhizobium sp. SZCCHNR1093]|uniref:hypothetical protein n=1 Tax=Bradyrhizobium sp. SZCCHNR1093 TaxID=3057368 RepID=UPI0028E1A710|nr:hypothetical protein [Bradyrhizobium sp. SZCCHNR1093]